MSSRSSSETIISHKKGTESRRDRRNALKEYYKKRELEAKTVTESSDQVSKTASVSEKSESAEKSEKLDKSEKPTSSLKDLIALENDIHQKISSNKALIKNIIYNNYFELVRINEFLHDVVDNNDENVETSSDASGDDIVLDDKLSSLVRQEPKRHQQHVLDATVGLEEKLQLMSQSIYSAGDAVSSWCL